MKWFFVIAVMGALASMYMLKAMALKHKLGVDMLSGIVVRERKVRFWAKLAFMCVIVALPGVAIYTHLTGPEPAPMWWAFFHGVSVGNAASLLIIVGLALALVQRKPAAPCYEVANAAWIIVWPASVFALALLFPLIGNTLTTVVMFFIAIIRVFI